MRAHAIAVERFESVSATVMRGLEDFLSASNPDEIISKAREFDEAGEIRVTLRVQLAQKECFQAARVHAGATLGEPATTRLTMTIGLLCIFPGIVSTGAGTYLLKES